MSNDPRSERPSVRALMSKQAKVDGQYDDLSRELGELKRKRSSLNDDISVLESRLDALDAEAEDLQNSINILLSGRVKRGG